MNRRKFITAVGALSTGAAAAIGTGAVTTQESTRNVDVDIASDSNGSLSFQTSPSSLENSEYAETSNGQLTLQFDGRETGSEGLNPDSTYYFDNVFQIDNLTPDGLNITFDKSGLDHPDAFTFYGLQTNGNLVGSRDSDWSGTISSGYGINIGVKIETPDNVPEDWETGSVIVVAKDLSDENV